MIKLKISDLSFCEVTSEEEIEVKGGLSSFSQLSDVQTGEFINDFLSSRSVDFSSGEFSSEKVGTTSSGDTIEEIEGKGNGLSGINFKSKDGTTKVRVLKGPGSSIVYGSSIQTS